MLQFHRLTHSFVHPVTVWLGYDSLSAAEAAYNTASAPNFGADVEAAAASAGVVVSVDEISSVRLGESSLPGAHMDEVARCLG